MTPYQWSTDDDEVSLDAIIGGIASDKEAFTAAGIDYGPVPASIFWPDWLAQGEMAKAAIEGPYPVPEALERAEILCTLWALNRVVIAIPAPALWRREWGELREVEGFD